MTSPEVARYLEPQSRFEALRVHHLRRSGGRLIDLAYPNCLDDPPPGVREAIADALRSASGLDLQYTPYGGATVPRRRVAHGLRKSHGVRFRHSDVLLTPGAMSALSVLLRAAARQPGDEAVIVSPCWLDSPLYARQQGLEPVLVDVRPSGHLDLGALERAIGPRTRVVLLSQPANPTGVLYHRDELSELARLLTARAEPPLLISDECHRDFLFGGAEMISPASLYERAAVVYSFGKRLLVQGQRLGYAALRPELSAEGWSERATALCRAGGYATPTALMQRALPRLLEVEVDLEPFERRRARAVARLREAGIATMGAHTMFVYARVPGGGDDFDFAERAAAQGVLVLPSSVFHQRGWFRLSMTARDEDVDAALGVLTQMQREAA